MSTTPHCNTATLSRLFQVSERRIQQLAKQGIIKKQGHGQYELIAAVQSYIAYLHTQRTDSKESEHEPGKARLYKTQLLAMEVETQAITLAKLKGELVPVEEVHRVWNDHILTARAKLLTLPRKAAGQIKDMTDYAQIERFLTQLVDEALDELADDDDQFDASDTTLALTTASESE